MTTEIEKDWPFPWHKSKGIYDSDGPKKPTRVQIDRVWYFVSPTGDDGIDTNRARQFVACLTCDEIVHHNTTGPSNRILYHHKEEHTAAPPKFVERVTLGFAQAELMALPTPTEKEKDRYLNDQRWREWAPEGWRILWWENDPDDGNKRLIAWAWAVSIEKGERWLGKDIQAVDDGPDEEETDQDPADPTIPEVGATVEVHFSEGDVDICPVVATAARNFCVCTEGRFPGAGDVDGDELMILWPFERSEKWYLVQPGPEPRRKKPLTDAQRAAYDAAVKRVVEITKAAAASITVAVDEVVGTAGSWVDLECKEWLPSGTLCVLTKGHAGRHEDKFSKEREASAQGAHGNDGHIKNISILMKLNMGPTRKVHMQALIAAANRLQISTEADFNGVTVLVRPGDDLESLDKNLLQALEQKQKFAMADRKQN